MTMTMEQVQGTIAEIVQQRLGAPQSQGGLHVTDSLAALRLDSMAVLDLIVHLEEVFLVDIIDEELNAPEQCRDIQSLARLVMQKLAAAGR